MARLDVYVERRSNFLRIAAYKLKYMLRRLSRANLSYRVLDHFSPDDAAERGFLHVDLTEVPKAFQAIHRHYPECVNGRAATISRLLYSRARVFRDDPYAGPVIVKTILNHRGLPELRLYRTSNIVRRCAHALGKRITPGYEARLCPVYRAYPSLSAVPAGVWTDPRLMVERFLPGRLEPPIVKYRLDFFYDVELNMRSTYGSILCDPKTLIRTEVVTDVPAEVIAVRRALHLDFGAIDYFVLLGDAFVIDANKTVTETPLWMTEVRPMVRYMELAGERLIDFVRGRQI
jgi:hypothetical protein